MSRVLGFLQNIGRSLMTPIAVLPAAAILLGLSGAIDFGDGIWARVAEILGAGAGAIFNNLPLLFAIGVAIGMTNGAAVAGLASTIGYLILVEVMELFNATGPNGETIELNMGVLGGIMTGIIAVYLYRKYKDIQLPKALGFFGGRRFIPIVTSLTMVAVGVVMGYIWLPIQRAIESLGMWIVEAGSIGLFFFGVLNRLLIPFGLHHIINSIAWFQIGSFTNAEGEVVNGDLTRFFAGDPSAGMFMTGFFPVMMFGLPAACIAMMQEAKPEKRAVVGSVMLSAAFASFLTGITEPIEFAFMFVAPLLFVIHALLTGLSMAFTHMAEMHLGFGFSAGLIDYLINWHTATRPWLLIPFGAVYFIVYYVVFRFCIRVFRLKTPGREEGEVAVVGSEFTGSGTGSTGAPTEVGANAHIRDKASALLPLLGGETNIQTIDACITRLRLTLSDDRVVDEKRMKDLGASGVIRLGKGNVQVVFGTESEQIKDEMQTLFTRNTGSV